MKTVKALVASAGLVMAGTSAMATQANLQVDAEDLVGTWNASIAGEGGEGTVRVVFLDNGSYLAMALIGGEEGVPFWEIGEWEVDDDTLTFEATSSSEPMDEDDQTTEITIEDLDDGVLHLSNEEDPMWGELEFVLASDPVVGTWVGDTQDGEVTFMFAPGGGFAAALGDGEEVMWGTWSQDDDEIAFEITDDAWAYDYDGEFEQHAAQIEDMDDDMMMVAVEGLTEEAIEWNRVDANPITGEWTGSVNDADITFVIDEGGTFEISMESEDEEMSFAGIWTVIDSGQMFLAVQGEGPSPQLLLFVITGPDTIMFGESMDDMEEFTRE